MAYPAGVLKALQENGIDVASSDVMVGTSAGSIMASYLATGWDQSDFYEYAHGRHPDVIKDPEDEYEAQRQLFEPLWGSRSERVRRSVGSFFALAASKGVWNRASGGRTPIGLLRRSFPAGLYSTDRSRARFAEDLPANWPAAELYICTTDLYTGKRVAFGAPGAPEASLPEAVLASIAIPGVFPSVRIGGRQYVDGGAVSATSLDLAMEAGCTSIICIAPLGYRSEGAVFMPDPALWGPMLTRSFFARTLKREVAGARAEGIDVLVIRPWVSDLKALGSNAMRRFDRKAVVEGARAGALRLLDQQTDHPALVAATS
jgi:NTE family protein